MLTATRMLVKKAGYRARHENGQRHYLQATVSLTLLNVGESIFGWLHQSWAVKFNNLCTTVRYDALISNSHLA